MTAIEVMEAIAKYTEYDEKETIQMANGLIEALDKDLRSFIHSLSGHVEDYADDSFRCPLCGKELTELESWIEPHGEEMSKYGCPDCGYAKE